MNLSQIFRIFRRRWLFMLIPAAIVLVLTIFTAEEAVIPPPTYNVGVRFLTAPPLPPADATALQEEQYYQWLTSEYLANGLADWSSGIGFAEKVSVKVAERGFEIDPLAIFNGTSTDAIRSRLTIIMNYGDRDALQAMIESAIEVIEEENTSGIPHLGLNAPAEIVLLDTPVVNEVPASIGNQLDLPVRIVLAVIVGLLIGFLAEYFDPYIRDVEDVAKTGIPILAQGPATDIGRNLRGSLLLQDPVPSSVTIGGIAGALVDEASLDVAFSLAKAMARSGRKTILVDGILSRPQLHSLLNLSNSGAGLAESLANGEPVRLQDTGIENLSFLAGGNGGQQAADLISSPRLAGVMASLKKEADMLIVLAPAQAWGMDISLLAAHTGGTVITVERSHAKFDAIEHAQHKIEQSGTRLLGATFS